jgi:parallel beta-helix repeat protein
MKRLHAFILLLILLGFKTVSAEIILVDGDVYGVWSADTVLVQAELHVPPDSTLIIMPGVEVLFIADCKLIVMDNATLQAVGTEAEPIRFDVLNPNNFWHGIRFLYAQDSSRLEHCTIKRGWADGADIHGGALQFEYCSPAIVSCVLDSCTANGRGGAVWGNYSNVLIDNCTISNNHANDDAGAIYFEFSNVLIDNCTINNNHANDDAGGIYLEYSNPIITNCEIVSNSADDWCGGIRINEGTVDISNNTISANSSWDDGGGIVLDNSYGIVSNNTIEFNTTNDCGGGIKAYYISASIIDNIIKSNFAGDDGGGIILFAVGPGTIVSGNVIVDNATSGTGGGICCWSSGNTIENNIISNNASGYNGGGIYCSGSNNIIHGNFISGNTAGANQYGGGIYISNSYQVITDNVISYNSATYGGGIYADNTLNSDMRGNSVAHNTTLGQCGGVYLFGGSGAFYKNTVRDNTATTSGGLLIQLNSYTMTSLIVRGNSPFQISGFPPTITYSDIEGGWPGTGNIDANPLFATGAQAYSDISWGSPCIDTGNPSPLYADPDYTVSDMGGCYFDQSKPVRMLATPMDAPIVVPAAGGSFILKLTLSNSTASQQVTAVWCDITLPSGSVFGPVIGPIDFNSPASSNVDRLRTQNVPAGAPYGIYHYNAYAVVGSDTSKSSFVFAKLGSTDGDSGSGWINTGDPFEGPVAFSPLPVALSEEYLLIRNYPNPFNPVTTIGFSLPSAGEVLLTVYDVSGRTVATLADGYRNAGQYEIIFDASQLASGIYIYSLETGQSSVSGKMVLMK